ncbi:MAG: hypothetical protein DHS20C18_35620 [Saprospiraceae bacterium]|nr:MAG: hypothetical protein DHS20C18_35620 [Saprospiraceae bacterium]
MNKVKAILIATAVAFIAMFTMGGLWNALILEDFYISNSPEILRPEADFNLGVIALGYFVLTLIMAFIVMVNMGKNPKFVGGFMFGATFGLAATLPLYLILYGRWDFSLNYALVDTGWHFVEQGIGGLILTALYFKLYKPQASKS